MRNLLVFPGQGSQYIGMGKDFFDNHISGGDVIHGGRNFIPNTSLDWHDLC